MAIKHPRTQGEFYLLRQWNSYMWEAGTWECLRFLLFFCWTCVMYSCETITTGTWHTVSLPKAAKVSLRSFLSMKPSLFWSMIVNACGSIQSEQTSQWVNCSNSMWKKAFGRVLTSLNSWIWACSNMENTLELAPSALFFAFLGACGGFNDDTLN